MNVVVSNKFQDDLLNLDIDIIKSITGEYRVDELVEIFKNFFYSKMILDVTALKNYDNIETYKNLVAGLDASKILFLLPSGSKLCTYSFLSNFVKMGCYNFTSNIDGIKYLLKKSNTKEDAEKILSNSMASLESKRKNNSTSYDNEDDSGRFVSSGQSFGSLYKKKVIGIKNVTDNAGATTFTYLLKKEIKSMGSKVVCFEINKSDFSLFNDKDMISIRDDELDFKIDEYEKYDIILIDLNKCNDLDKMDDVIYLIEPSIVKLNRLVRDDRDIFIKLKGKKIVLNMCLLDEKDISDFEYEANTKIFYSIPPVNDRIRNSQFSDFIRKCNYLGYETKVEDKSIFGLFRR